MNIIFNYLFLCSILLLFTNPTSAQWTVIDTSYLKVEYTYKYKPHQDQSLVLEEPVLLLVGKNWIQYCNAKNHELDKVLKGSKKQAVNFSSMAASTKNMPKAQTHSFTIYRKPSMNTLYIRHSAFPYYQYEESNLNFQWRVTDDRKELSGYECIKALGSFRGRDYVAWFAPEIPILAGPYKFGGLPGLIVKIQDTGSNHVFTLNHIRKYEGPLIKSLTHEYKVYGKWLPRYLKKFEIGVRNGEAYANKTLKQPIRPNSAENREMYLIYASLLNPLEIE
jgi:GLPGLI family protein